MKTDLLLQWIFRSTRAAMILVPFMIGGSVVIRAQAVLVAPKVYKNPAIIPMPDLGIMDLFEGKTPTSVYIQIGNTGGADCGPFWVKLSIKKKGSTTKTYVQQLVDGIKSKTDREVYIDVRQPIADLEIGVFVDSRNQIKEPNEKNCGKLYPGGGVSGYESCEKF